MEISCPFPTPIALDKLLVIDVVILAIPSGHNVKNQINRQPCPIPFSFIEAPKLSEDIPVQLFLITR